MDVALNGMNPARGKDSSVTGYAKAVFEIGRAEGNLERVADEFFHVARTLEKQHDLRHTLTDLAVPLEGKEKLLEDLLAEKVSPQTLNTLKFIVGQGKARQLIDIADQLARLAEEESKREIAEVRTAVPLNGEQTKRLEKALGKATGKNVTLKVVVDPGVIGGIYARVGDVVIDGSVRHRLEVLRDRLNIR